jgi:hypothetical protein
MKNIVPYLGKDLTEQSMRYQDSIDKMEPLCDHCRKKLTNQILPQGTGHRRVFRLGNDLYRVEQIT